MRPRLAFHCRSPSAASAYWPCAWLIGNAEPAYENAVRSNLPGMTYPEKNESLGTVTTSTTMPTCCSARLTCSASVRASCSPDGTT